MVFEHVKSPGQLKQDPSDETWVDPQEDAAEPLQEFALGQDKHVLVADIYLFVGQLKSFPAKA